MTGGHAAHGTGCRGTASGHPIRGAAWMAFVLAALLGACNYGEPTAGGSSEVDNPVVIAMVDAQGRPVAVSGSLGLYLADQSPALNPSPRIEIRLEQADSIVLLPKLLASAQPADGAQTYNLYLQQDDDSAGAFLRDLVYDPGSRRFTHGGSLPVSRLDLTVAPLERVECVLEGTADSSGVNRLIIPGSPFQTVLVDSMFVFDRIPAGIYPLHMITPAGSELPLPEPVNTQAPGKYWFNPDTTPVERPAPPVLPDISVDAGPDRTLTIGMEASLAAGINGVKHDDKRLSVLWRQLPPTHSSGYALIENPTRLNTRVVFPRTGAYTFVVTAVLGVKQTSDTVTIGVQAAPEVPVFIEPGAGDTLYANFWSRIVWMGTRHGYEFLNIELSRDSGATWTGLPGMAPTTSWFGFNERYWIAAAPSSGKADTNCFLRLTQGGTMLVQSPRFTILAP